MVNASTNPTREILRGLGRCPGAAGELLPCGIAAMAMLPPSPFDMQHGRIS
jgi:hypothetical protein